MRDWISDGAGEILLGDDSKRITMIVHRSYGQSTQGHRCGSAVPVSEPLRRVTAWMHATVPARVEVRYG